MRHALVNPFGSRNFGLNGFMASAKIGRPSKGDRDTMKVRPPMTVGARIRAEADRRGIPYGDLAAAYLCHALGAPELAPVEIAPDHDYEQQEWPIAQVA